jgi:hypothetical protein
VFSYPFSSEKLEIKVEIFWDCAFPKALKNNQRTELYSHFANKAPEALPYLLVWLCLSQEQSVPHQLVPQSHWGSVGCKPILTINLFSSCTNKGKRRKMYFKDTWGGSQATMAHACNPSYSGDRDQDCGSKPAQTNSSLRPYFKKKKKITEKGWWSSSRCRPWVQTPVPKKKKNTLSNLMAIQWHGKRTVRPHKGWNWRHETESHYINQARFELVCLLSQPPKS